jgi:hypothetical protein
MNYGVDDFVGELQEKCFDGGQSLWMCSGKLDWTFPRLETVEDVELRHLPRGDSGGFAEKPEMREYSTNSTNSLN